MAVKGEKWEREKYWRTKTQLLYRFLQGFPEGQAATTPDVIGYMNKQGVTTGELMSIMAGLFRKKMAFSPRPGLFKALKDEEGND